MGSKVKMTYVLPSHKLLAVLRARFDDDHHCFSGSFCSLTPSNLMLYAVRFIVLWTVLGSAVACDGSIGLDEPFEACLSLPLHEWPLVTVPSVVSFSLCSLLSFGYIFLIGSLCFFATGYVCTHFCLFAKQF